MRARSAATRRPAFARRTRSSRRTARRCTWSRTGPASGVRLGLLSMDSFTKRCLLRLRNALLFFESRFDRHFLSVDVQPPRLVGHAHWRAHLQAIANRPGARILEVGSRMAAGAWDARGHFPEATYVGFDFLPGSNVDVVGDAHRLSSYFTGEDKFDLVFSAASFEHFAMPWVVATEIAKVLKVGGHVFVE